MGLPQPDNKTTIAVDIHKMTFFIHKAFA